MSELVPGKRERVEREGARGSSVEAEHTLFLYATDQKAP